MPEERERTSKKRGTHLLSLLEDRMSIGKGQAHVAHRCKGKEGLCEEGGSQGLGLREFN